MANLTNLEAMPHERAPGFTAAIATYAAVAGPTPDGMVHIQFYRDLLEIRGENLTRETSQDGKTVTRVKGDISNYDIKRSDVAIISMPADAFNSFARGLAEHLGLLKTDAS